MSLLPRISSHSLRLLPFSLPLRTYASLAPSSSSSSSDDVNAPYQVFDRNAKRLQKDRAAAKEGGDRSRLVDYLRREVTERVLERFEDVSVSPRKILEICSGPGLFSQAMDPDEVDEVECVELSEHTLMRDPESKFDLPNLRRTHLDEEQLLSRIPENSQDAVISTLGLHWVNDLPGVLRQIQRCLKPDGFFLGAMLGGDTLFELRTSLQLAQQEREGGISLHVSPMADPKDASNLLQRAGFTLLTVDTEDLQFGYPSMFELVEDLKDMGEGNAVIGRRTFLSRDTLIAASAIYNSMHGSTDPERGFAVPATFSVIFLMGWKPSDSQPKALPRGSGRTSLKEVL
ncbi:S-adenosyl-L-methionine-dependent methyltransferase [Mrakia frigida]|uniref:S-adenosyl-L-methionine-dependent methyltransferase n=1 Tax=Mrakia frigida TaxID=29902 RepID=UPI003FCBFC42